jgi:threonine dehydrogenase-like Zn-dependent dehydrogenase
MRFFASWIGGTTDGTFREYVAHPATYTFKLPENVDLESGALVEPFSVGMHACRQAGLALGQRVLIYGVGPIGLAALLAARNIGVSEVWVTDIKRDRLQLARQLGATFAVPSNERIPSSHFDGVLECAGARAALEDCLRTVAPGGTITLVGGIPKDWSANLSLLMGKEARLTTVFRYANTYPIALHLIAAGRVDLRPLISHRFPFSQLPEAMEVARQARPSTVKVMVEFP